MLCGKERFFPFCNFNMICLGNKKRKKKKKGWNNDLDYFEPKLMV